MSKMGRASPFPSRTSPPVSRQTMPNRHKSLVPLNTIGDSVQAGVVPYQASNRHVAVSTNRLEADTFLSHPEFSRMSMASRRQFLGSALAAGAACSLAPGTAPAIDPIARNGKSHLRLSIAAYGYRKYLDLKANPRPSMALEQFVEAAAEMGVDAVEPTAY